MRPIRWVHGSLLLFDPPLNSYQYFLYDSFLRKLHGENGILNIRQNNICHRTLSLVSDALSDSDKYRYKSIIEVLKNFTKIQRTSHIVRRCVEMIPHLSFVFFYILVSKYLFWFQNLFLYSAVVVNLAPWAVYIGK